MQSKIPSSNPSPLPSAIVPRIILPDSAGYFQTLRFDLDPFVERGTVHLKNLWSRNDLLYDWKVGNSSMRLKNRPSSESPDNGMGIVATFKKAMTTLSSTKSLPALD